MIFDLITRNLLIRDNYVVPEELEELEEEYNEDNDFLLKYMIGNYIYNTFYKSISISDTEIFKIIIGSIYFQYLE